jgi:hypothetical protein
MRKRRPQLPPLAEAVVSWAKEKRPGRAPVGTVSDSSSFVPSLDSSIVVPGPDSSTLVPSPDSLSSVPGPDSFSFVPGPDSAAGDEPNPMMVDATAVDATAVGDQDPVSTLPDILDLLEGNGLVDEDLDELPTSIAIGPGNIATDESAPVVVPRPNVTSENLSKVTTPNTPGTPSPVRTVSAGAGQPDEASHAPTPPDLSRVRTPADLSRVRTPLDAGVLVSKAGFETESLKLVADPAPGASTVVANVQADATAGKAVQTQEGQAAQATKRKVEASEKPVVERSEKLSENCWTRLSNPNGEEVSIVAVWRFRWCRAWPPRGRSALVRVGFLIRNLRACHCRIGMKTLILPPLLRCNLFGIFLPRLTGSVWDCELEPPWLWLWVLSSSAF